MTTCRGNAHVRPAASKPIPGKIHFSVTSAKPSIEPGYGAGSSLGMVTGVQLAEEDDGPMQSSERGHHAIHA